VNLKTTGALKPKEVFLAGQTDCGLNPEICPVLMA